MSNQNYERTTDNIFNLDDVRRKHELAGGISHAAIISSVPGIEQSKSISPEESVENIKKQLAERAPGLPSPDILAGSSMVAQYGSIGKKA